MRKMIPVRSTLGGLSGTVHGGQAWKTAGVEDYSHNLNPFGPPEDIGEIIGRAVGDIGHYPDDSCSELKDTISRVFRVGRGSVMIGAGSSDIIRNFPNTFIDPGDRVLLNRPSFAEYAQQCRIAGAGIVWNDLTEDGDLRMDPESVSAHIASGIKALYICNPNNPTGRIEPRDKVLGIVRECRDNGVLVFLDETLLELVPDHDSISCAGYVGRNDNLVVIGSLTKSFAIPGIRIGFGFADESLVREMEKVRMTWNVGQIEQTVANELIGSRMGYVRSAAEMMAAESKVMHSRLSESGFPIGDVSDSFFYFSPLGALGMNGAGFQKRMLEHRIMVRDCASFGEPFDRYARFSVKDRRRNDLFVEAAEAVMKGCR